jgi:pimeloyl-ACP methyl ester carboxylesterase
MQDIYIGDEGKGFPLVLVHGFLGSSKMWEPQIDFFKDNFRVITPDLPGFGESYKVKSLNSISEMAKKIFNCIDKKNIKEFHLIGHSMGGMIAQEMANTSKERINKLVCFATGSIGDIPDRFETIDASIQRLKKEGIKETTKRIPPKWFVEGRKSKYFYLCENAVKKITEETAFNALTAMKNWNGYKNLKNIKNKTLIVWGDKDKSYNFEQIDTLKKNIPNSKIEIFKGCCHNAHLEKTEKFNQTIYKFLNNDK